MAESMAERAAPVGTPAYIYDLGKVREAYHLLRSALPEPSQIFYSLKANPHPAIVRVLHDLGCSAEVCSPGELAAALEAGVPPDRILYTGPGKRDAEVTAAARAGVRWFSVDSPAGLAQVHAATGRSDCAHCLLRVNQGTPVPGPGLVMSGSASQFGADAAWIEAEPEAFRQGVRGFHLYMGTNLTDERALVTQFGEAISTARRLCDRLRLEPEVLNLGGGFGAPFARSGDLPRFHELGWRLSDLLDDAFPGWRDMHPVITFESGRYLSATCGQLRVRVLDVKQSHGRPVVVLESGINHLGGMSGMRRLPPIVPELITAHETPTTLRQAIIAGPLCTPLDTWARAAEIPEVKAGDIVAVPNVGAYGLSASLLAFLGHPAPREVIVDDGQIIGVSQLRVVRHECFIANSH